MKKISLAIVVCCFFNMHALATSSNAKFKSIDKKINALKDKRENIDRKMSALYDGSDGLNAVKKEKEMIEDKIISLERSGEIYGVPYIKARIEKKENEIKGFKLLAVAYKYMGDMAKISLDIAKTDVELTELEIKIGKPPKIPLNVAKIIAKRAELSLKVHDTIVRNYYARIKEGEAYIKFLESGIKKLEKSANDEIQEQEVEDAMLRLKLRIAQAQRKLVEIEEAQAKLEVVQTL